MKRLQQLQRLMQVFGIIQLMLNGAKNGSGETMRERLVEADQHVVHDREAAKEADILKGACDAKLVDAKRGAAGDLPAIKDDAARSGPVHAADDVECRGFPGS